MGEASIVMRNVHIVVDSEAQLGLVSKGGIRFMRDEGSDEPLLTVTYSTRSEEVTKEFLRRELLPCYLRGLWRPKIRIPTQNEIPST